MRGTAAIPNAGEVKKPGCRRRLSLCSLLIDIHMNDGPKLTKSQVPGLLVTLLGLTETIMDVRHIGAALDFDRQCRPH